MPTSEVLKKEKNWGVTTLSASHNRSTNTVGGAICMVNLRMAFGHL